MELIWPCEAGSYEGVFDIAHKLGQGAFSTVFRAYCKPKVTNVAIKVMDLENISTSFEDILLEVQTMKLSNHENILRCYVSFVHETKLWLVLQYMNIGSCLRVMSIAKKISLCEGFNEEWVSYIIFEALKGLNYLHNAGFLHRDVKSGNILLSQLGEVRLADFGVAGWILNRGQRQDNVKTFVGTLCYMSPEIMEQTHGYDQKADIWSLGITTLELAKGYAPYAKYAPMKVLVMTIEEDPPSLQSYKDNLQPNGQPFSRLFEDLCEKCLQKDARMRLGAEDLLKHKFFKLRNKESCCQNLLNNIPLIDETSADFISEKDISPTKESAMDSSRPGKETTSYVAGTTWIFDDENLPSSSSGRPSAIYRKGHGVSEVLGTEKRHSRGKMVSISVLRNSSSSGQAIVRISSVVEKDDTINDFLDDFETENATMKMKSGSRPADSIIDKETLFDEIQSISKDSPP
jgi:serine/threonine-protein kinase OSR1/STK39